MKLTEKEAARYNRQILLDEIGEAGQLLLKQARVLIVGVGGLGSPVALYLAGAGVGTIGLIDDDTVSETNLQRQVLYSEPEIGLSKAEQAKLRLQALNSDIRVEAWNERLTPQNAECLIANYDIVVDGCDNFRTRYLINDTCVRLDKVYVYGAIREFDGQVSVFNYQGGPDYRTLFPDEEGMLAMPHPSKAVLGVTPGVVGCVEANETMKVILGSPHALSGRLWHIDLKSMESYVISLVQRPPDKHFHRSYSPLLSPAEAKPKNAPGREFFRSGCSFLHFLRYLCKQNLHIEKLCYLKS